MWRDRFAVSLLTIILWRAWRAGRKKNVGPDFHPGKVEVLKLQISGKDKERTPMGRERWAFGGAHGWAMAAVRARGFKEDSRGRESSASPILRHGRLAWLSTNWPWVVGASVATVLVVVIIGIWHAA